MLESNVVLIFLDRVVSVEKWFGGILRKVNGFLVC